MLFSIVVQDDVLKCLLVAHTWCAQTVLMGVDKLACLRARVSATCALARLPALCFVSSVQSQTEPTALLGYVEVLRKSQLVCVVDQGLAFTCAVSMHCSKPYGALA